MKRLIIASLAALSVQCFNYEEEIWVNEDLSGKIKITVTLGEMFATAVSDSMIGSSLFKEGKSFKDLKSIKGITLVDTQAVRTDTSVQLISEFKFDKLESLNNFNQILGESNFFPRFEFPRAKTPGLLPVRRTIKSTGFGGKEQSDADEAEAMATGMTDAMFGGMKTVYILHSKKPIFRSNADTGWTGGGFRSCKWTHKIAHSTRGDHTLSVDFASEKLKTVTADDKRTVTVWPSSLAQDSLRNLIGTRKLFWGTVDSAVSIPFSPGISDLKLPPQSCFMQLTVSWNESDKKNGLLYSAIRPPSGLPLQKGDPVPVLTENGTAVALLPDYNNFLGNKIVSDSISGYTLKALK